MSKKDKKKNQAREPWEQSIYEPDQNGGGSRLAKRQQQRGNSLFLTVLVILLLLIIAIPIGTFLWMMQDKKPNESASKKIASHLLH